MQNINTDKTNKKHHKNYYRQKFNKPKNDSPDNLVEKFDDIVVVTERTNMNSNSEKKEASPFEHKSIPIGLVQKLSPKNDKHPFSKSPVRQKAVHEPKSSLKEELKKVSPVQSDANIAKKQNEHTFTKKNSFSSKHHPRRQSNFNEGNQGSKTSSVIPNLNKVEFNKEEGNKPHHGKSFSKHKKSVGNKDKPFKHKQNGGSMSGDPKSCPYLSRMKNTKEEEYSESIEFEDDVKVEEPTKAKTPEPAVSLFSTNVPAKDTRDLLSSILNEPLDLKETMSWKPAAVIDINEINRDFEEIKVTENTSTVLMSNAEIEILNKRAVQKHPDDDGGPYVLKLTNLQKGFNSEEIVKEVLKPKGILYLRTKFFWEPNFKVTFDDMKKMCFLEVKYYEEIDRCIQILKKNNYLIKAEKCKHDDFVTVSKLQNSQWGDPEFVNKADQLNYKILKYKINFAGDPIGILKEGEEEISSPDKLPTLPTLGTLPKKDIKKSEVVLTYSEMAEKIVKNKQKAKEQEEASKSNSSSAMNSPSMTTAFISSATLGNNSASLLSADKTKMPRSSSSSTYVGSENSKSSFNNYKGNGKTSPTEEYKKYGGKSYKTSSGNGSHSSQNRYKPRNNFSSSRANTERKNSTPSTIGYGFAASFGKNAMQ